ncbi:hypothetical protein BX666DRAFT_1398515 [Dichotomocladium elegans]|nr:hypothetical protein BX666DRAFT_1398515 [Dichotomocladium elegans]
MTATPTVFCALLDSITSVCAASRLIRLAKLWFTRNHRGFDMAHSTRRRLFYLQPSRLWYVGSFDSPKIVLFAAIAALAHSTRRRLFYLQPSRLWLIRLAEDCSICSHRGFGMVICKK